MLRALFQSPIGENGDGIIRNINMAISWYQISAEQGYKKAQSRMEILLKKYR
jgi:TPR repeat protein